MTDTTKWYFLTVTYDGTIDTNNGLDRVGIYIDGIPEVTTMNYSEGGLLNIKDGTAHFGIGNTISSSGDSCGTANFDGLIDDVRIYDTTLSATEIQAIYNENQVTINSSQNNKLTDGLVGLWSFDGQDVAISSGGGGADYTVSGAGETGYNGDYVESGTYGGYPRYTLDSSHWIINDFGNEWLLNESGDSISCPAYGTNSIEGTWFTYCSANPAPTVTAGGGGGSTATAYDRSGNSNDGTLTGGPTPDRGIIGQAMSFDGVDDYISVADDSSLRGMSELTISMWAKKGTADIKPVGYWDTDSYRYYIFRESSGTLQFYTYTSGQVGGSFSTGALDGWHHYVARYDGSEMSLYIDGVKDSTTFSQSGNISNSSNATSLIIGAEYDETGNQDGSIDDVRIYDRALSSDEITRLYKLGARE